MGGAKHSLKKRGIGLKKKVTPPAAFKSKLMEKQKKFLVEAISSARVRSGSTRTTDRSFVMDDLQKKSIVDVVNSRPCMYCSNRCNSKPH